jgi:trehalose-phosphatase
MVVRVSGLAYPKHVSEEVDLLARALGGSRDVYLFLDYGGTLVPGPAAVGARPEPAVVHRIEQLCRVESCSVFVVSGRTVQELEAMLRIPNLGFVGQRGFEIKWPDGPIVHPVDPGTAGHLIEHLELDAHGALGDYPGVTIENRGFGLALRLACDERRIAREATHRFVSVVRALDRHRQLEILYGEDVVEAGIAGWHKGDAVSHILREADVEDSLAIYVGDDVTDEDAFEALSLWSDSGAEETPWFLPDADEDDEETPCALSILVATEPRPTQASLFVRGPKEVHEFLSSLAAIASALL